MPLVLADRVRETTTTTGTGTISLAGPVSGFQGFSTAIGNANTTYYTIVDAATGAWEVGLGTYTSSGSTLARTTVLSSSNSDALVPFASGTKDVFVTQPAERAVYVLGAGTGLAAGAAAFTANGVVYANATNTLTTGSALTYSGGALLNTGSFAPTDGTNIGEIKINAATLDFNTSSSAVPQVFRLGSSEQMRLTSTGLGIGTSSPASKLHVAGDIQQDNANYLKGKLAAGTSTRLFGLNVSNTLYVGSIDADHTGGTLFVKNGAAQMTLDSSGNLGIGTSSPGYKLDVVGAFRVTNSAGNEALFITGNSNTASLQQNGSDLYFNSNTNTSGGAFSWRNSSAFTERMRLDSSGNLGLGVTPSAWSGVSNVFQIKGNAYVASTTHVLNHTANAFFNGTNWIYTSTNFASQTEQVSGTHVWKTAASGIAGDPITFTQAMTLNAGGNLGVGVTSPIQRIEANGNIKTATGSGGTVSVFETDATRANHGVFGADVDGAYLNSTYSTGGSAVLRFLGANTERARITSGGYSKFSNDGNYTGVANTYHEFYQTANNTGLYIRSTNGSYTATVLECSGDRATTNTSYYLFDVYNGNVSGRFRVADSGNATNTNGSYGTISDAKMKTDILDAGSQWADIKAIRFRKFKMKDDPAGLVQLGVVAQELEQTSPGLVEQHTDRDAEGNDLGTTTKSVKTSVLLMKAAVALQEAMARIEKLEAEVATLKGA